MAAPSSAITSGVTGQGCRDEQAKLADAGIPASAPCQLGPRAGRGLLSPDSLETLPAFPTGASSEVSLLHQPGNVGRQELR